MKTVVLCAIVALLVFIIMKEYCNAMEHVVLNASLDAFRKAAEDYISESTTDLSDEAKKSIVMISYSTEYKRLYSEYKKEIFRKKEKK